MSVAYGILCVISLALIGVCRAVDRKKDINLLLLFVSVFVCNLGHFLLSIAPSLTFALNANRIAYLGQVFLPLLLLRLILDLCNLPVNKWVVRVLSVISVVVLLITLTPGICSWYYNHVSIEVVDGTTRLIRDYGPLHLMYYGYLFLYFSMMLTVILLAAKQRKIRSKLHIFFLLSAVLCSIVIWLAEQFLPRGFEFLTVSYTMTELFILLLYGILQEYGIVTEDGGVVIAHRMSEPAEPEEEDRTDDASLFSEKDIARICSNSQIKMLLTERENEVLGKLLTSKPRKEIAQELFVTENTIKKHTTSIFKKLDVKSRLELYGKLKQYM